MKGQAKNALALAQMIRKKEVSVREIVLQTLGQLEKAKNATVFLMEEAIQWAEEIQQGMEKGRYQHPLAGVPIAVKDNILVKGAPVTCASAMLKEYIAPYHATAVERLLQCGIIPVCKANCDEFAMGALGDTSIFGPVENPWKRGHTAGGSSSGSAALVAGGFVPLALGSDTGGSIRQPAAFCGITGFLPSYGAVSRYGLVAHASSFDQIGPMAATAEECQSLFAAIAGQDARDSCSVKLPVMENCESSLSGVRIGVLRELTSFAGQDLTGTFKASLDRCNTMGAQLVEVQIPHLNEALAACHAISAVETSSNLGRYDGVRYGMRVETQANPAMVLRQTRSNGFGDEVKARIILGTLLSLPQYADYYRGAQAVRQLVKKETQQVFTQCDIIATPTCPGPAPKLEERLDPIERRRSDSYVTLANLCGLPAISLPCGWVNGLPVGMQWIGKQYQDKWLLAMAKAFQDHAEYHCKRLIGVD